MPSGIRATVRFDSRGVCPIADLSADTDSTVDSVSTSVHPSGCSGSVTEFSASADCTAAADVTPVFSHGSTTRYRLAHDDGVGCPCECLGRFGYPVARYVARHGTLTLVFHAVDYERLQAVVAELRDRFPGMEITRLVGSPAEDHPRDGVLVDRSKLTTRFFFKQKTAYEMGYFDRPRRNNATTIAAALDVCPSTFREHLAAAESKLLEDLL